MYGTRPLSPLSGLRLPPPSVATILARSPRLLPVWRARRAQSLNWSNSQVTLSPSVLQPIAAGDSAGPLGQPVPVSESAAVPIRADVVGIWERLLEDDDSKDVILTAGGETTGGEIELRAHSLILMHASDVFKRMLSSPMQEGQSKKIKLQAYTAEQVRFLLRLLYTGLVDAADWGGRPDEVEPPLELVCAAAALGKQYDFRGVAEWMVDRIKPRLAEATFELVMSAAIRADLGPLRIFCVNFAKSSAQIHASFERREYAPEVLFELQANWDAPSQLRGKKRKSFC